MSQEHRLYTLGIDRRYKVADELSGAALVLHRRRSSDGQLRLAALRQKGRQAFAAERAFYRSGCRPRCDHAGLLPAAGGASPGKARRKNRSEEHTSELQSLMRNSYAVFCLK